MDSHKVNGHETEDSDENQARESSSGTGSTEGVEDSEVTGYTSQGTEGSDRTVYTEGTDSSEGTGRAESTTGTEGTCGTCETLGTVETEEAYRSETSVTVDLYGESEVFVDTQTKSPSTRPVSPFSSALSDTDEGRPRLLCDHGFEIVPPDRMLEICGHFFDDGVKFNVLHDTVYYGLVYSLVCSHQVLNYYPPTLLDGYLLHLYHNYRHRFVELAAVDMELAGRIALAYVGEDNLDRPSRSN